MFSFKVKNFNNTSRTIEILIRPQKDQQGNDYPLNFACPKSEIVCEVYGGSTKLAVHFTKLDPNLNTWGQFDWDWRIVEKNKVIQVNNSDEQNQDNSGGTGSGAVVVEDSNGQKACPVCTFLNDASNAFCEICQSSF
jgi:hypothetical protein